MHPQSSCYNFISIHNKISKLVLHRQSSPFIPAFTLHNRLHPFLYFPPRLPQVYRPHKDAMPRLLIPIRKVEILIHGRVDQSSASIQSMRLAPVFLVHHVRKNLREMIPANLLPATKLRNQRLAVELGIKNKLLLRIRIESVTSVSIIGRASPASLNIIPKGESWKSIYSRCTSGYSSRQFSLQKFMRNRSKMQFIRNSSSVNQKLQSAILILAGKGRVPNQPADIKNQRIPPQNLC